MRSGTAGKLRWAPRDQAAAEDSGEKAPASSGETSPAADAAAKRLLNFEAAEEAVPQAPLFRRAEKTSEDAGEPTWWRPGQRKRIFPPGAIIPSMAEKPSEDDGEAAEAEPGAAEESCARQAVFPDRTEKASKTPGEPAEAAPEAVEEDIPPGAIIPGETERFLKTTVNLQREHQEGEPAPPAKRRRAKLPENKD